MRMRIHIRSQTESEEIAPAQIVFIVIALALPILAIKWADSGIGLMFLIIWVIFIGGSLCYVLITSVRTILASGRYALARYAEKSQPAWENFDRLEMVQQDFRKWHPVLKLTHEYAPMRGAIDDALNSYRTNKSTLQKQHILDTLVNLRQTYRHIHLTELSEITKVPEYIVSPLIREICNEEQQTFSLDEQNNTLHFSLEFQEELDDLMNGFTHPEKFKEKKL